MTTQEVYDALDAFPECQWKKFARVKLAFDDKYIDNMFSNIKCVEEVRYQIFTNWQEKTEATTEEALTKLTTLKLEFFFSKTEKVNSKPIQVQGDSVHIAGRDENLTYPRKYKKGMALIIGNYFETTKTCELTKHVCANDMRNMEKLWKTTLGCDLVDGKIHKNKTADEMKHLLTKLGQAKECDYVVAVISTHGGLVAMEDNNEHHQNNLTEQDSSKKTKIVKYEEVLYGNDWSKLPASEIQEIYRNETAPSLQDIPKLFILQYCRGEKFDVGVEKKQLVAAVDSFGGEKQEYIEEEPVFPKQDPLMPSRSDILTVYPTQQEHEAYGFTTDGSWIIKYIHEIFMKYHKTKHVTDMLTIVNDCMKRERGSAGKEKRKAMSVYESSLTKDLYLA